MAKSELVPPGVSVSQLMEDLTDVSKWHSLGTHLGLEASQLDVIEQEIPTGVDAIQRRKGRVLDMWMKGKTGKQSWRNVVSALMKMGEHSIAKEMRKKYNGSEPVSEAVAIAKENQQQINGEFVKLQMLICERLQAKKINMEKFLYFIKGLFQCADFIPASKIFLKIDEIFEVITHNGLWDFINYSPLRQIAKAFARDDEEINAAIHKYRCALAGYLAGTKLADHIASMSPISEEALNKVELPCARMDKRYFNKLTIKLNIRVTEESLDYLIELWDSVSEYLGLPSLTYMLDDIHEGCVSATWLIPPSAMPAIFLKISDPETATFLSKLGIIKMEVDDLCLYEEQEQSVETAEEHHRQEQSYFVYWFIVIYTYLARRLHICRQLLSQYFTLVLLISCIMNVALVFFCFSIVEENQTLRATYKTAHMQDEINSLQDRLDMKMSEFNFLQYRLDQEIDKTTSLQGEYKQQVADLQIDGTAATVLEDKKLVFEELHQKIERCTSSAASVLRGLKLIMYFGMFLAVIITIILILIRRKFSDSTYIK